MSNTCVDPALVEMLAAFVMLLFLAVVVKTLFGRTARPGASEMNPVRPRTPKPMAPRRCPSKCMGECGRANEEGR